MIFEMINLFNWKKKREILKELKENGVYIHEREFRLIVKKHNKLFCEHKTEYFIAHSNKGYKLTKDEEEIMRSAMDYKKRAIDQFRKSRQILKAVHESKNERLDI